MASNAERQGCDKIQKELKRLERVSNLTIMETRDCGSRTLAKRLIVPTVIAGLDSPMVQRSLKARQMLNISYESPLQACVMPRPLF